jgi:hypothetical protein
MKTNLKVFLFAFALCASLEAQTKLGLTQLPDCAVTASTPTSTPIVLALVATPNGTSAFACYTLSGVAVTPATATTPASISIPAAVLPGFVFGEVPFGAVNGTNGIFTLANAPIANTVLVWRNGLLLQVGQDYVLAGSQLTFTANALPQSGDTLQAAYHH